MEDNLTYWKNYEAAMQWIQGNSMNYVATLNTEGQETMQLDKEDEELEFTISDDLLDFYRLSRDHKVNRS